MRAILVPGFSVSERSGMRIAEGVGEAYAHHGTTYNAIDVVTFPDAMDQPSALYEMTCGADVITHSAGIIALHGASPRQVTSFCPVLPSTRTELVLCTIVKGVQMLGRETLGATARFHLSSGLEIARHPLGPHSHLQYLLNGTVSGADAFSLGSILKASGTAVSLVFAGNDAYYPFDFDHLSQAKIRGIKALVLPDALHDSLVLHPEKTTREYLRQVHQAEAR